MSKSKPEEVVFSSIPHHLLLKHSQQVRSNIEAENFEAEREAAKVTYGLTEGDSSNGVEPENRKPPTRRNGKQQQHVEQKPDDPSPKPGDGTETAGADGEGEPDGGTEAGTPPEAVLTPEGGAPKNPWD